MKTNITNRVVSTLREKIHLSRTLEDAYYAHNENVIAEVSRTKIFVLAKLPFSTDT